MARRAPLTKTERRAFLFANERQAADIDGRVVLQEVGFTGILLKPVTVDKLRDIVK